MKANHQRWWDIPAAIFLVGALFSAAFRLQSTHWTAHLDLVALIVALGAVLGFALGKSQFSGRVTFGMGLVYTLFAIPWQLGLLIPDMKWLERLNILYARLWYATADFINNKPVQDPILFLTTMLLLYWLASLFSTYRMVRRANPWIPLLSLGVMILIIEYSVEMYQYVSVVGGLFSFAYLIACLLLMGRIYFLQSRKEWEQRGGTIEMEVGYDLGRGVIIAAVAVAALAWYTPQIVNFFEYDNPAGEQVSQGWRVFRDRVSNAVNTLRSPSSQAVQGYGSAMPLGTGGNRSQEIVFTVKPENGEQNRRMYWSAHTYDRYDGGQWSSSQSDIVPLGPQYVPLPYPSWILRQNTQFTFNTRIPLLRNLFFINEPFNLDRDAQAIVSQASDGATDFNSIVLDPPLKEGDPYTVRASVAFPTVLSMRQATTNYPEWITDRYLQMPENFSPRVSALASQIAAEEETNFDKVQAITQYLRRTITYTETVPTPPEGQDPLEWFLFDERAGFCNYYASAEVMMLRSLGIPARLVVGYAEGQWNAGAEEYEVRGRDSHAWPEVYFPELGWIQFEPTVSQPSNAFPEGEVFDPGSSEDAPLEAAQPTPDPRSLTTGEDRANQLLEEENQRSEIDNRPATWLIVLMALGGALLIGLGLLGWMRWSALELPLPTWLEKLLEERGLRAPRWLRRWSQYRLRSPIENLFGNVALMLWVWGQKVDPSQTPSEQVNLLIQLIPQAEPQARTLLKEYQRAMYSPYLADTGRARQAVAELRSIGLRSWVMHLVGLQA